MKKYTIEEIRKIYPGLNRRMGGEFNVGNTPQSVFYNMNKDIRIKESLSETSALDSFIKGVYKFEIFHEISPENAYDKNVKIVSISNWKVEPESEYEEGFQVLTRVNPLLYQLNSKNFLEQITSTNITWFTASNGNKWPTLCVENFNNLIDKEIYVREITLEKNNQGQDAYRIDWTIL